jgi:hypothetical protein
VGREERSRSDQFETCLEPHFSRSSVSGRRC